MLAAIRVGVINTFGFSSKKTKNDLKLCQYFFVIIFLSSYDVSLYILFY